MLYHPRWTVSEAETSFSHILPDIHKWLVRLKGWLLLALRPVGTNRRATAEAHETADANAFIKSDI